MQASFRDFDNFHFNLCLMKKLGCNKYLVCIDANPIFKKLEFSSKSDKYDLICFIHLDNTDLSNIVCYNTTFAKMVS